MGKLHSFAIHFVLMVLAASPASAAASGSGATSPKMGTCVQAFQGGPKAQDTSELSPTELKEMIHEVFNVPRDGAPRNVRILLDTPPTGVTMNANWEKRFEIARGWARDLKIAFPNTPIEIYTLTAAMRHNAELPDSFLPLPSADGRYGARPLNRHEILSSTHIFFAMTEFSLTAPMIENAKTYKYQGGTMPAFNSKMNVGLRLPFAEIRAKCDSVKRILEDAETIDLHFVVSEGSGIETHYMASMDVRFRKAQVSSAAYGKPGRIGNLPTGETYIVPYEGEYPDHPSRSAGYVPIQIGNEIVVHKIKGNRTVEIAGVGPIADAERAKLLAEPMARNVAELGFGILSDFGIEPIGTILLDEKLGFHMAWGRSEHLGGVIGPAQFLREENVFHQDYVYTPTLQPKILVKSAVVRYAQKASYVAGPMLAWRKLPQKAPYTLVQDGQILYDGVSRP